jgi:hypothetical protein
MKRCDIGEHDVSVLFHSRRKDRPSCCPNCYQRKPIRASTSDLKPKLDTKVTEGKKVPQNEAKRLIMGNIIKLVDDINIAVLKKKYAIKKISDNQKQKLKEYRRVRDCYLAKKCICEFPDCQMASQDLHHGAGKVGKLLTDTKYFKALCRKHHIFVEENPTIAQELGLSFKRLDK